MKSLIVWLLLCVIWGTTWIFIKFGLEEISPIIFAAIRFSVASIILLPILFWQNFQIPKTRQVWFYLGVTGFLQFFFNYGLVFWSEQFISSGLAAVLQATIPAFGLVLARFYLFESITAKKIFSLVLGLAGVAVIFWEQLNLNGEMAFAGSLGIVAGAFGAALASVLTKAKLQELSPGNLVFWQMLIGHLFLWVVGLLTEKPSISGILSWKGIICILYLAVMGSIVAFWLYYWLLTKIEVSKAMMIAFVTPIVAVIIGIFWAGESLQLQTFFGGILILGSVGLIVFKPKKSSAKETILKQ